MADFATILKTLRLDRKLSQQELANSLGISKSAVSMYEQGKRQPDFDTLGCIADFFQADMDYLLGRTDSAALPDYPVTIAAHLDTSGLTQDELDDVADYIKFIRIKRSQK